MASNCHAKLPAPSLTPAYFLNQIYCLLGKLVSKVNGGTASAVNVNVQRMPNQAFPYGADRVDWVYDGAFIETATYSLGGNVIVVVTYENDGTNYTAASEAIP